MAVYLAFIGRVRPPKVVFLGWLATFGGLFWPGWLGNDGIGLFFGLWRGLGGLWRGGGRFNDCHDGIRL